MKAIYKIWGLLSMVATLMLTACSSEDDTLGMPEQSQNVKIIPYTVTVNGDASTRASVDENMKTLKFADGDKLYISGTNISGVMDLQTGSGTASATFSGSLTYTGEGSPADDLSLNATLVSAQQTDGVEVTIAANKTVTVNYGTALCEDLNTAVEKYSCLKGTSTYGSKSFSLTQQTAFLNFAMTLNDGTSNGASVTATLTNAKVTVGTYPSIYFALGKALSAKVYNIVRTYHNLRKTSASIPASEAWVIYQTNNESSTGNNITIGDGGVAILAGVNIFRDYTNIACSGNATIVIADGSTNSMIADDHACCIAVGPAGKKLTIKGEYEGTGIITGGNNYEYYPGIGAGENSSCGDIEILSGNITIRGGNYAAGIGTGSADTSPYSSRESVCGNITISGGTVHATGGNYGAGIGSGRSYSPSSTITISGGNVTAIGGSYAAGIGGGAMFRGDNSKGVGWGDIVITGGTVVATMGTGSAELSPYDIGAGGIRSGATGGPGFSTCGTVTVGGSANVTATNNRVQDYPNWPQLN